LNLVAHKVAPALASKNSIIIKPSPRTPLTALLLGEVFLGSGLPKNALQIVPLDVENIDFVLKDERIGMISFTGSDVVGWKLKERVGRKPIALELGGNASVIIDESADLKRSLERTTMGAFTYSGQTCISVQRIFIHDKIFDEWTSGFVEKARNLKIGKPLDKLTQLSVLIDENAAKKTEQMIKEALDNGAELLCGGGREGAMLEPTVLTKTSNEMRVVSEEAFAPVAVVEKFSEFDEAIEMSNQTRFGLQAGVFTNDFANLRKAAERLEYGGVIINDVPTFRVDNMPYGGVKQSGFGREGLRYAMEEMSDRRLIVINS
jgi:acyl-CoA reductase-like NAD-dependent aldehyde dehydrogenase